jgi:PRTRC genetic system protein A
VVLTVTTSELSPLDACLQASCPTVMAPHQGALPELSAGKRLVMAADGLYLEVRSESLHALQRLIAVPTPYGPIEPFLRLSNGPIPTALLRRATDAAAATPNEVAFCIVSEGQGTYRLIEPTVHSSSLGHITYADTVDDNALVIDLHSHGDLRAFFSAQDDRSDLARPGPYIAIVIGRCSTAPEIALRLVSPPYLIPLPPSALQAIAG